MTNLKVAQLDFDAIKENMKIFLENQTELQDYNFSGSTMNIMMDAMAYVTHYNGVYANMQLNETFLDTAILRSSVVSRAKELGYIPRQYTAAFAPVTITVNLPAGDPRTTFEIPKGTKFAGEKDGIRFNFTTVIQYVLDNKVGDSFVGDIIIHQGEYVEETFVADTNIENQKFRATPEKIDTDYTEVEVLPFVGAATREIFTVNNSIVEIDGESNVFFWEENLDGDIDIFFGDGVLGKPLGNGNQVKINTLSTEGANGNAVTSFAIVQNVADINRSNIVINTNDYSKSGSDRESINSIKTLSPRLYTVQDRLVTLSDYRAYIRKNFGNIQSLSVWGGDENIPAFFGRVFVSIKPTDSDTLSTFEKSIILDELQNKIVTGITVELVDPELLFVSVNSNVTYDNQRTVFFPDQFEDVVTSSIQEYFDETLNEFGNALVYSQLVSKIDESNDAIVGNLTTISLSKKFIPIASGSIYLFDFANPTQELSFFSNDWSDGLNTFNLRETTVGQIDLYRDDVLLRENVGTIEHSTGIVQFREFNPSITINTQIVMNVTPAINNVIALRNNILVPDQISVQVVAQ